MTRTQKADIIEVLSNEFKDAQSVIFCDYKGLSVSDLEGLRKIARAKEAKVQVVKNTLATIALEKAELTGVELKDTNILVWGEDSVATAKVVAEFAKDNEKFVIKSAYVDREAADAAKVEAFAKLPGREELLGMLAATWMAPLTNLGFGLSALKDKK
jgi:large subunit ribosomal protein L10